MQIQGLEFNMDDDEEQESEAEDEVVFLEIQKN